MMLVLQDGWRYLELVGFALELELDFSVTSPSHDILVRTFTSSWTRLVLLSMWADVAETVLLPFLIELD